jgi:TPR repeat protein
MSSQEQQRILGFFEQYITHNLNVNGQDDAKARLQAFASRITPADVESLRRASAEGMTEASCLLAACLIQGWHVMADKQKGGELYLDAARKGNAYAQHTVAGWHEHGAPLFGCPQNQRTAIEWYEKAAAQTFAQSQSALGRIYFLQDDSSSQEKGWKMLNAAAEKGIWSAMTMIARAYEVGDYVQQNKKESLRIYRKLAKRGCALSKKKARELGGSWWKFW